jgi:ABC-2 type transport system ATP-binding protein
MLQRAGATITSADDALVVSGLDASSVGRVALEAGIALHELRAVTAELEDVFMDLTSAVDRTSAEEVV